MNTPDRRSPAEMTLDQFAAGLRERAAEVGVAYAEAPELVRSAFKGGDASSIAQIQEIDLPQAARGLRCGGYAVILGLLPEAPREEEVMQRLRKYRNQCVVARSYLAPDQSLDLHLFLVGPRGSERSEAWQSLALMVERDDKVARKLVWLRPAESPEATEADRASLTDFVKRTFLARPWQSTEVFSMAHLDSLGRGIVLSEVPRDTIGDWNRLAIMPLPDTDALVAGLVDAWAMRGRR